MNPATREQELLDQLEGFGDPRKTWKWGQYEPDYVRAFNLTRQDIPQLLTITKQWIEREDWPDDQSDLTIYAPIHAWRALAQLGAEEAVSLLIDMIEPMDQWEDDWHLEEFPTAFGMIGPASLSPLAAFLANSDYGEFSRICAGHGLCELANRHAATRVPVVEILTRELSNHAGNPEGLNAFLISYLIKLKAVESAEVIERAYADECVDEWVVGNWDTVRQDLGVQGLGLVPEWKAIRQPPSPFPFLSGLQTGIGRDRSYAGSGRAKRKRRRRHRNRGRRR
ncbi:MAG: DUF1186 domain-containing protein [Actinobacteria bacterium]|nr:DUF1186 domain-containing protein [Actinomycetota bacterium]